MYKIQVKIKKEGKCDCCGQNLQNVYEWKNLTSQGKDVMFASEYAAERFVKSYTVQGGEENYKVIHEV